MSRLTCDELAARFESLGDNCELGLVQRCFGAEPLGLFRFSGAQLGNIIDVISSNGTRLFTRDDINLIYNESIDEYLITSKNYHNDFQAHTNEKGEQIDIEAFLIKHAKILQYFKARFFGDLVHADKIYVRKGSEGIVDVRRLHAALKRHGPNRLLWVTEADRFHAPGTVEKIEDGLWRGYVSRFKRFSINEPIDLENWFHIMDRTYKQCNPGYVHAKIRRLARGKMQVVDLRTVEQTRPRLAFRLNASRARLVLKTHTGHEQVVASTEVRLDAGQTAIIVLSIWIKIDEHFEGEQITIGFIGLPPIHSQQADLGRRGKWQRIWTTIRLPGDRDTFVLAIMVGARQGSVFSIGDWTVEAGPIPKSVPSANPRSGLSQRVHRSCAWLHMRPGPGSDPKDVLHWASRALAQGRFVEADDVLAVALSERPDDRELLKQYALSAHNSGRYVAAIIRWKMALSATPDDPMCHAGVASNFREFGETNIAASVIGTALGRFPDDGTILTEAARIAMAGRRYGDALSHLTRAIELFGPIPHLLSARAEAEALLPKS